MHVRICQIERPMKQRILSITVEVVGPLGKPLTSLLQSRRTSYDFHLLSPQVSTFVWYPSAFQLIFVDKLLSRSRYNSCITAARATANATTSGHKKPVSG